MFRLIFCRLDLRQALMTPYAKLSLIYNYGGYLCSLHAFTSYWPLALSGVFLWLICEFAQMHKSSDCDSPHIRWK